MKSAGMDFTHFILYRNIKVNEIDLFEDACGLKTDYMDVIEVLNQFKASQRIWLTERLIRNHRKRE
jgi:hypothetical protein